jgi:4-amino-4-deoxy-L-arabinose transferase-like glycosyltransferase
MRNFVLSLIKKQWPIILIVLLALFLRLFRIADYMTFLGDEGRDALVWLRMMGGKFVLIGPQTSIGNMYLGPLFYYLMFPFYLLLGTIGPSIGTALFAGVTTYLLWFFGKEWFSPRAGMLAAFFYAVSPVAITLSRSAWNPNIMPLLSLLVIWGIWQFWQKDNYFWLVAEGVLLSLAVQSHYLGLLLVPLVGLFFLFKLVELWQGKTKERKSFIAFSLLAVLIFLVLTFAPLVWFDLRHNFINYKSFHKFFTERQTTVNLKPYKAIPQMVPLWQILVTRLLAGKNELVGFWLSIFFGLPLLWIGCSTVISLKKSVLKKNPKILLLSLFLIGLVGMGLYKQHIYDHYFGFLFPAVFLLAGLTIDGLWRKAGAGKLAAMAFLAVFLYLSLKESPLKYPPNQQMGRTAEVCRKIIKEADNEPFNLGMIAKQNYDAGYRYFLEKWGHKPLSIDALSLSSTVAKQLFVVCEDPVCQPVGHAQAEIANFGWSKIGDEWVFPWGTKLFKLTHY